MANILILTKNVLAEQDLQYLLQRSNEEVYCSSSLVHNIENEIGFLQRFPVIIFSDTIPFLEISETILFLKRHGFMILRKGEKSFVKATDYSEVAEEIDEWIDEQADAASIMEKIARVKAKNTNIQRTDSPTLVHEKKEFSKENYQRFISKFTKTEQIILSLLFKENGQFISRARLCQKIWQSEPSNSTLSQLSTNIAKLKRRIVQAGFSEEELVTVWGKGYQLSENFLSFLEINNFSQ
jgi:Response regulators consisting of a CheY-like receiver domain and a winged-helix DNA-binding domain